MCPWCGTDRAKEHRWRLFAPAGGVARRYVTCPRVGREQEILRPAVVSDGELRAFGLYVGTRGGD